MHTNEPVPRDEGVDVTADSPLPDIPDAGNDSQPISSPDPIDISTATLNADSVAVAGTFYDDDHRTLYEQAVDAEHADDSQPRTDNVDQRRNTRRVRIYDSP